MVVAVKNNSKPGFYNSVDGTVEIDSVVPRWPYVAYATPTELTGSNPIHVPSYVGEIDHIMVLDKNWVVVSTNVMPLLFTEINTLSAGYLQDRLDLWRASVDAGNPNYTRRAQMWETVVTHNIAAKTVVEVPLGIAANFDITSADDANYSTAQNPSQCTKVYYCMGGSTDNGTDRALRGWERGAKGAAGNGVFRANYRVYSYLQMPTSMVNGDTYTITRGDDSVTFLFDDHDTVSRAIKVNQHGYMSNAGTKKAYLGAYLWEFGELDLSHVTTYEIIDASTGSIADSGTATGTATLVEANPTKAVGGMRTGIADGTAEYKLIHSAGAFGSGDGALRPATGDLVTNTTDSLEAYVVSRDSDTQLTLTADIMASGKAYTVSKATVGEDVYEIDFSSLTDTGTFYIRVPGVGRSWPFEHATTVLSKPYYSAMRQFYRQRIGTDVTTKYTHWAHKKARMGPYIYESELLAFPVHDANATPPGWERFDVARGSTNRNIASPLEPGGWYDAADWDESHGHLTAVFDMLHAYEINSANLTDNQVDIPESGNGIPDILSEARHGLELCRQSQDANGGITSFVETFTHPNITHVASGPGTYKADYGFGTRVTWASLVFAAAAAQYARLVTPFDSADALLYQGYAEDAYSFGSNPSNSLGVDFDINYLDNGVPGVYTVTETTGWSDPYLMHAKLQLWLLTGTDTYITDAPDVATLEARIQGPYVWRWERKGGWSPWIFYSIIQANDAGYTGLNTLAQTWRDWFTADANDLVDVQLADFPYGITWDRTNATLAWGHSNLCNRNRALMIAYEINPLAKYRNAALQNIDFMFGCNPMGTSWMTGIGYVYPADMQHELSEQHDLILDPHPGITLYGQANNSLFGWFQDVIQTAPLDNPGFLSLTQSAGTATAQTEVNHGLSSGDSIRIKNATESEYNGRFVITETGLDTFTFTMDSNAAATATGTPIWYKNFIDDSQVSAHRPYWRKFQTHPSLNVGSNEFTISETMAASLFAVASLVESYTAQTETPRDPDYLWGQWIMQ